MNINNKVIAFCLVCELLVITGCDKSLPAKVIPKQINVGHAGIIGDYNFYKNPPNFLKEAYYATGIIAVYDDNTDEVVSSATGIYIKNVKDNTFYILTAAHSIYNISTKKIMGQRISFGYIHDKFEYKIVKLEGIPNINQKISRKNDWVYIPIKEIKNRPYLNASQVISLDEISPKLLENIKPEELFSISFIETNSQKQLERIYQTNFLLKFNKYIFPLLGTDMDTVKGMSGAPILHIVNDEIKLIGITTSKSKTIGCSEYKIYECSNTISLISGFE